MPHLCAAILAMQLTCVVDKEIVCTDNYSLAQLLSVPSCEDFLLSSPRGFVFLKKQFGNDFSNPALVTGFFSSAPAILLRAHG